MEQILKSWVHQDKNTETRIKQDRNSPQFENKEYKQSDTNSDNQMTLGGNLCKNFLKVIEDSYKQQGSTHTIHRTFSTALAVLGKHNYMINNSKNCLQRNSGAPLVQ